MDRPPRSLGFQALLVLALCLAGVHVYASDDVAFFENKVRPLLVERCYECHADKKQKGGLRLDTKEAWQTGGDSGPAIVAGNLEESLFIKAIRYRDDDFAMPPKKKLPEAEIAILEEWVKRGAPDPRTGTAAATRQTGMSIEAGRNFWAYKAPVKVSAPAVKDAGWPRGEIDRFILAGLETKGLSPAPDAAPEKLIRRISFALTGLPPGPEEIARFISEARTNREETIRTLVDRLIATPQFAEKWARHWLDIARFAESSGGGRTLLFKDAWRYRDYVLDAFNRDLPFDQFIREQIAGDLLPCDDPVERARRVSGTAFLALGPTNYEEQDKQQLRFDVIDEQLDTIGKGLLGQTIGCARCHDHKFDPIAQQDYYAMAGIFASTRTLHNYTDNVTRWVTATMPVPKEDEGAFAATEAKLEEMKTRLEAAREALDEARKATRGGKSPASIEISDLAGIVVDDSQAKVIGQWEHSKRLPNHVGDGYLTDLNQDKGTKTLTFVPKIPKSGQYEVRIAYTSLPGRATNVPVTIFHANGEDLITVNQQEAPPIEGRFLSLGSFRFEEEGAGYVLISNEGTTDYVVADAVQFIPDEATAMPPPEASLPRQELTGMPLLRKQVKDLQTEVSRATKELARRPLAMSVRDEESVGDTEVRVRGLVHQKGERTPRGLLRVALLGEAPAMPAEESGRRELAEWLASDRNPLTARVFVNRVWSWLFGAGIVRSVDNFGTTGEKPSHPELLDFLAVRFMEEGWSVKRLVREIVLSRAWQQSVAVQSADPENRLFGHAARRRLDADQLRDSILSVSGALSTEFGGPNIAGAGEIDANNTSAQNVEYKYEFKDTRRSIYTPAFRNKRLELFETFDFGDANVSLGQRNVSTVAPQALYLLNHPFVLEQARLAAQRTVASSASDSELLERAYLTALGRSPTPVEAEAMTRFLAQAPESSRETAWAEIYHVLFASLDFRYLD